MMGVVIVWMAGLAGWARTGLGAIVRSHCPFVARLGVARLCLVDLCGVRADVW